MAVFLAIIYLITGLTLATIYAVTTPAPPPFLIRVQFNCGTAAARLITFVVVWFGVHIYIYVRTYMYVCIHTELPQ